MSFASQTPSLSPVLLAGLVLRPMPPALFQPLITLAMAAMRRHHSEVFGRLACLGNKLFLINPVDFPFRFLLRPGARPPRLTILRDRDDPAEPAAPAALISGPLLMLLALLEGREDGDALFFSRILVIEGDTEAVLTLRNAIDSAEIDVLEVMTSALGPLSGPARRLAGLIDTLFGRIARDLDSFQRALLSPVTRRCDAQAAKVRECENLLAELHRRAPGNQAKPRATRRAEAAQR